MKHKMSIKRKGHPILVVVGPTASGKSGLAVRLAKRFGGEIISADSRQVYKGMDIGTAKVTQREMGGIRHHLLDVADPKKRFSAGRYRDLARAALDDIARRGKLPIVCGGTGFYIDALLGENVLSDAPPNEALQKRLSGKSPAQLLLALKKLDPKRAKIISKSNSERNNARRLIRAIEIASSGKRPIVPPPDRLYMPFFIGIKPSPAELKKRILDRLEKRLRQGMIAEARRLHSRGLSWKRMDELGLEYRYMAGYLRGRLTEKEFKEKLATEIWHYAQRQMTWWRRNKKIKWFEPDDIKNIGRSIKSRLT